MTPEWISTISTLILVIATCIYVYYTTKLAEETKKLRELETNPFLSLQIDLFRNSHHLQLTIKNIGKAPAYNISFNIDDKYKDFFDYNFNNRISYFAPEQKIECFGKNFNSFEDSEYKYIPISLTYYSKDNIIINDTFNLEWHHLAQQIIFPSKLKNIEKSLDKISKSLEVKTIERVSRLKILELHQSKFKFSCLFSNGYLGIIDSINIHKLKITDSSSLSIINGNLYESSTNLTYSAEELYYRFNNIKNKKYKYQRL